MSCVCASVSMDGMSKAGAYSLVERRTHLFPVHVTLCGEEALVACGHAREAVTNEVGLGVVVAAAHDVIDCKRVGSHESTAADEAAVDESGAVRGRPTRDEACVLLVMHLAQVAHEERGRRGTWEVAEGGARLAEEEKEEGGEEVEDDREAWREEEQEEGHVGVEDGVVVSDGSDAAFHWETEGGERSCKGGSRAGGEGERAEGMER